MDGGMIRMGWSGLKYKTLTTASDTISVDNLSSKQHNMVLYHVLPTGGNAGGEGHFGEAANIATRRSGNGGADTTAINQSFFYWVGGNQASDSFAVMFYMNIPTQEKLAIKLDVETTATGAGTAPNREEQVLKYVNTTIPISTIVSNNTGTGDFGVGSNLSVLGTSQAVDQN